jgi:FMN phosphatase YigB (HAD superfamily)
VAVSNWDIGLPAVLGRIGLGGYLDGSVSSGEVGRPKPARGIFRAALAVAGTSPAQAVHVGDSVEEDVRGALGAGITPVLLRREPSARYTSRRVTGAPAAAEGVPAGVPVINSLEELPTIICAQGG